MLARSRLCFLALLVPWTLTCSDDQGGAAQVDSALVDEKGRPSVGQFENRGNKYNLHDLMDPLFRATHPDPYVQEFDPDVYFGNDASATATALLANSALSTWRPSAAAVFGAAAIATAHRTAAVTRDGAARIRSGMRRLKLAPLNTPRRQELFIIYLD